MFLFIYKNDLPIFLCNNRSPRGHLFCLVSFQGGYLILNALKLSRSLGTPWLVCGLNSDLFRPQKLGCRSKMADLSPPSKFIQQSQDPINRNIKFEAFTIHSYPGLLAPWLNPWLNSDLFRPQKLVCRSKMADLSALSKFAQQSENPLNRNFNFGAFKVI